MDLSFITALLSAPINIKNNKWNALSVSALITSFALFIAKAALEIKLSKEYDRRMQDDTKVDSDGESR